MTPDLSFASLESLFMAWSARAVGALGKAAVDLPPAAWWIPALVLLLLAAAALYDAYKGRVPDFFIVFGLLLATGALGLYAEWTVAAQHLLIGIAAAMVLTALNQLYYNVFKHDAIGMGDAKWTALAVTAFGIKPALWAWVIGAWLGLSWMALKAGGGMLRRLAGSSAPRKDFYDYIHFAPFLFLGLLAGVYWHYVR